MYIVCQFACNCKQDIPLLRVKSKTFRTGGMAHCLRALDTLAKEPSLVPSTNTEQNLKVCSNNPKRQDTFIWPSIASSHIYTFSIYLHRDTQTHIYR